MGLIPQACVRFSGQGPENFSGFFGFALHRQGASQPQAAIVLQSAVGKLGQTDPKGVGRGVCIIFGQGDVAKVGQNKGVEIVFWVSSLEIQQPPLAQRIIAA